MRVRELIGTQKVYADNLTLRQNAAGKQDFKPLLIQTTITEEYITDEYVLIFIRRWFPVEQKLGPTQEVNS